MPFQRVLVRLAILSALLAVVATAVACGGNGSTSPSAVSTSSGSFTITDLTIGTGATAITGNRVTVGYTGWLYDTSKPDGKGQQFDSGTGFTFTVGAGQVIAGWDQGIPGMKVGGQRRLLIPPTLAYGNRSPGGIIPANATLLFDVTLLSVN